MQHPSVLSLIARQHPRAAASIAASSRTGRSAAQRVATMAAASTARAARGWADRSMTYRELYKEAKRLYDLRTFASFKRTAERLGYRVLSEVANGSHWEPLIVSEYLGGLTLKAEKIVTDRNGKRWEVAVQWNEDVSDAMNIDIASISDRYWSVSLQRGERPYYHGPVPQHARGFFDRVNLYVRGIQVL